MVQAVTTPLHVKQIPGRCLQGTFVTAAIRRVKLYLAFCQPCSDIIPPGHWIQDCPTNDDREYDNRPRVKRTTGIPRSFLKAVEVTNDGPIAKGVMVTPEGGFVVAEPDS